MVIQRKSVIALFKAVLLLVLFQIYCASAQAAPTSSYQAEKVVQGWLKADMLPLGVALGQEIIEVKTFSNADGNPIYHVVYLQPSGFVIVPADDRIEPIIAFSSGGTYDPSPDNPLGAMVSQDMPARITAVRDIQVLSANQLQKKVLIEQAATLKKAGAKAQNKWSKLQDYAEEETSEPTMAPLKGDEFREAPEGGSQGNKLGSFGTLSDVRVPPLVESKWSQSTICDSNPVNCYNYYTPNNYVCGCVATAMAQLMRYHQYPTGGIGVDSFKIWVDGKERWTDTRGGDDSGGPYAWGDMVLVPDCNTTEIQRQAIGAICYDAGVAAHMYYTSNSSGAYMADAWNALTSTFSYSNAIFGWKDWDNIGSGLEGMLNPNLDAGFYYYLIPPTTPPISLRDDGLGQDRIAGDYIYTAGPFRFDTSRTLPDFYGNDPTSPEGLYVNDIGEIIIEELDTSTTQFLAKPDIGFLRSDIAATTTYALSPDIVVSPHLINICTTTHQTQKKLRLFSSDIGNLTIPIYEVLPDRFDFFMFFSTNKVERLPRTASQNFNAGRHVSIKKDYTGTGAALFDNTSSYGSTGRLLGFNILDVFSRGITAKIATHEIMHQWSSFISTSLGLSDSACHYLPNSSVASLIGGFQWIDNGDTTFTVNYNQGRNGDNNAPPLDKYMMGLIDANDVPTLYVAIPGSGDLITQSEIETTVTITDIINQHGLRSPGPNQAQYAFNLAFVAETHDRFLNETEMTFYEILAVHYTKEVPLSEPEPYIGQAWPPMTRYFGESTRWSSRIFPWADLSLDLIVDFEDLSLLCEHWLNKHLLSDNYPEGGDGIVNFSDWALFASDWQNDKNINDLSVFTNE